MRVHDKDDPIRIYLTDNPSSATQLQWKEDYMSPRQYGMSKKKNKKKKRV